MAATMSTISLPKDKIMLKYKTSLSGIRFGSVVTVGTAILCLNNGWKYLAASIITTIPCMGPTKKNIRRSKILISSYKKCSKTPTFPLPNKIFDAL